MTDYNLRELTAYRFINKHIEQHGYPPSRREIAEAIGLNSVSSAQDVVNSLVRKGVIEITPGTSRAMRVVMKEEPEAL